MTHVNVLSVHWNTPELLKIFYDSLERNACGTFTLHICDNGSTEENIEKIKRISEDRKINIIFRKQRYEKQHSSNHAEALEILLSSIADEEYVLVSDVDCYMLLKNWNKWFIETLVDNNAECIATTLIRGDTRRIIPFMAFFQKLTINKYSISWKPELLNYSDSKGVFRAIDWMHDTGWEMNKISNYIPLDVVDTCVLQDLIPNSVKWSKRNVDDFCYQGRILACHVHAGGSRRQLSPEQIYLFENTCRNYDKF